MKLYLVHDVDYTWRVVIQANDGDEAIEKLHKWFDDTKQNGKLFTSRNVKWIYDLCDNDIVIK